MMADRKKVEPLLRTARGQIDGVLKMIEDNRYCMDIMMQLQAVESLVHKAQREVLRGHLSGCVQDAFETTQTDDRLIAAAPIIGLSLMPNGTHSRPAAIGMPMQL